MLVSRVQLNQTCLADVNGPVNYIVSSVFQPCMSEDIVYRAHFLAIPTAALPHR